MKLSVIFYAAILSFNLLSLYFIIDIFFFNSNEDLLKYDYGRTMFYYQYVNILLNLYLLCYIAIKSRFDE